MMDPAKWKRLEDKVNRLIMQRMNPELKPMNLDEFAEYKVAIEDSGKALTIRHGNCPDHHVEKIELEPPLCETNLKWLMLRATTHWQEAHRQD